MSQSVNAQLAGDRAVSTRRDLYAFLGAAVKAKEQPVSPAQDPREPSSVVTVSSSVTTAVAPTSIDSSLAPCDGDLPPCWRIIGTESGGRWDAHNYDGCYDEQGNNTQCWGPYQFGGFWAGKLGLPLNLWTTTHDQWVNAARALWNNGAGCSNWAACNG